MFAIRSVDVCMSLVGTQCRTTIFVAQLRQIVVHELRLDNLFASQIMQIFVLSSF